MIGLVVHVETVIILKVNFKN